jgi:ABC-type lipopolysaccharide export system ATPase subunit
MNHILEVDGVQLQFNGRKILSGIYLKCETGKITGMLGKNGQGKSCLMKIIYGSLPCEKSIRFDHTSIVESFKRPDLLSYLPQFNFIPKSLSLRRVFQDFGLEYGKFQNYFSEFAKKEKSSVGSLSGGERRLIELYVIVKSTSQFAMLDEPFTHLNPLQIEKVKVLLIEEKENKGLLITDHMYRHIIDIYDNLYVLTNGQTYLTKSVADIETLGYARL